MAEEAYKAPPMPIWLVIRRENGHATPIAGGTLELFESFERAQQKAIELANQYQGTTFAVARMDSEWVVMPSLIKRVIPEEQP